MKNSLKLKALLAFIVLGLVCSPPCFGFTAGDVEDVIAIPQNAFRFVGPDYDRSLISRERSLELMDDFRNRFFRPWTIDRVAHSKEDALWSWRAWRDKPGWGENLRLRSVGWYDNLWDKASMENFGTLNRHAIAVTNSSMRCFPTHRPLFGNPLEAGEGYPFDRLQNTGLPVGTPLMVSHLSRDGAWAWVESGYAGGWVPAGDIGFVDDEFRERWMKTPLGCFTADSVPAVDSSGRFAAEGSIGTVLPMPSPASFGASVHALVPARLPDGKAVIVTAGVSPEHFRLMPLACTPWSIAALVNRMMGQAYGWGGMYGNRDCSATVKDLFAPFGIWLPRHSAAQARAGDLADLAEMEPDDKLRVIRGKGVPFLSLLRAPGHIMVYLGEWRDVPVIFHTTWGIGTVENGIPSRHVIGETVITTLEPGKNVPGVDPARLGLLQRLSGLTLLAAPGP